MANYFAPVRRWFLTRDPVGGKAVADALESYVAPAAQSPVGFGFEAFGIFAANELLGFASWPVNVVFSANSDSYLRAFPSTPATADAVFRFLDETLTTVGTITVAAGERTGTVAWTSDPYTHPADAPLLVYAPVASDATLGNVNALIVGSAA